MALKASKELQGQPHAAEADAIAKACMYITLSSSLKLTHCQSAGCNLILLLHITGSCSVPLLSG